jgi:hypothetical protein
LSFFARLNRAPEVRESRHLVAGFFSFGGFGYRYQRRVRCFDTLMRDQARPIARETGVPSLSPIAPS